MTIDEIREILSESLEVDSCEINNTYNFFEHENWDSLSLLTLFSEIDDCTSILLDDTYVGFAE